MKIWQFILLVLILIVSGISILPKKTTVVEPVVINFDTYTIPELVDYIAPQYNQDPALLKKIIYCESGFRHESIHDGGLGKGATGLHRATFMGWSKEMGVDLDYNSSMDQIRVMAWAFSQGGHYRDDWTTYRAYMNGGTYTFTQKKTGITYTSRCK